MGTPLRAVALRGLLAVEMFTLVINAAVAGEAKPSQASSPVETLVTKGRLEDGVVACEACHRAKGEGDAGSAFSNLTGLTKEYLTKQLKDFKSGARESRVMQVIAENLKPADIDALSAYYSGLSPLPLSTNIPEAPKSGAVLAESGDAGRGLASCVSCHSAAARSANKTIPVLSGQHPLYLKNRLLHWRDPERKGNAGPEMAEIAKKLTAAEIDAVAIYFGRLPKTAP
jgi:cytochrome c553